jgi:uncharacterized Rossmann fold enzyme
VNKVPDNLPVMRDKTACNPHAMNPMAAKGIGLKNNMTGKPEPLLVTPMDSVEAPDLLTNIQTNLNTIPKWLKRAKVHNNKAIIASAGPSLKRHLPEIKKAQENGAYIFCVKHSLPTLVEAGIIPEFCVILDPRPLDGISTHGIKRKELFNETPKDTTFLVASMTNKDVTKFLMDKGANVVGWHALANGIHKFMDTGKIDLVIAGGTCAGMRAINIAYNIGFRDVELVGFDSSMDAGWTPKEEESKAVDERKRPKYIQIFYKDPTKMFYSTGELVAQAQDLIATLENPNDLMIKIWDDSNYVGEIWKEFKHRFQPLDEFDSKKVSK